MDNKLHALVVVAHPDDESYLMSGTALVLAEQNKSVGIICATRGEKGDSKLSEPKTKDQIGQIREAELREAGKVFNAKFIDCLNYPDGELCDCNKNELLTLLTEKINVYQPEIIITFGDEGITGHKDHKTIGEWVCKAAKQSSHKVKEIWKAVIPVSKIALWNDYIFKIRVHHSHYNLERLQGTDDVKLLKIDIAKFRNQKLQAIFCHKSQGLPGWMTHKIPELEELMLGNEYFEVIKL